jgi:hypothetical protein
VAVALLVPLDVVGEPVDEDEEEPPPAPPAFVVVLGLPPESDCEQAAHIAADPTANSEIRSAFGLEERSRRMKASVAIET